VLKQNILKKPLFVFTFLLILLLFILFFLCNFEIPEYYIDKELAQNFVNNCSGTECFMLEQLYKNKTYNLYNFFFHSFSLSLALCLVTLFFNIKNWGNFINNPFLYNKFFIYAYVNFAIIPFLFLFKKIIEMSLFSQIYPSIADSYMIAILGIHFAACIFILIYYPLVNILCFIVCNTKFTNKFLISLLTFITLLIFTSFVLDLPNIFSWWCIILDFIKIIYLLIFINLISILQKRLKLKK